MITPVSNTPPAQSPLSITPNHSPNNGALSTAQAATAHGKPADSAVFSQAAINKANEAAESQAGERGETAAQESQEGHGNMSPQYLISGK